MSDDINKLKAAHERLKLLYQVSNVIHSTLDPQHALQLIMQEAVRLMRAASGSVGLIVLPLMLFHQLQLMVCAALARRYADGPAEAPLTSTRHASA